MPDPTIGKYGSTSVRIDIERLIETRLLLQANSGAGKSWAVRRLLEQTHGRCQQIVIDPEDEFHTLREKYDYVLAGRHGGDCPAEPRSAKLLARKLLELGVSAIVGIFELKAHERHAFVRSFLDAMVNAPRTLWHPCIVVIDEAHIFAPEKGKSESASAVIDLMTRGRKRGFCGVLATQRISKLHKDAAAECNNKLIGRAALDLDMKRCAEELGFSSKEQQRDLRTLEPGEFFAFGPALTPEVRRIRVGKVVTTHPRAGQRAAPLPPPRASVQKVLSELADLPQEAAKQEQSLKDAKARIRELERQIRVSKAENTNTVDVARYRKAKALYKRASKDISSTVEKLQNLSQREEELFALLGEQCSALGGSDEEIERIERSVPVAASTVTAVAKLDGIKPVHDRILSALAELEALRINHPARLQVALFAGYGNTASTGFAKAVSALSSADLIKYPEPGTVALTDAGRDAVAAVQTPRSTEEYHERLRCILKPVQWRVLAPVMSAHPNPISRELAAELSGYSNVASTGFAKSISRLSSLGLIERVGAGMVRASDILFVDSA